MKLPGSWTVFTPCMVAEIQQRQKKNWEIESRDILIAETIENKNIERRDQVCLILEKRKIRN